MSKTKSKGSRSSDSTQNPDFDVFLTVFFYCILIIILPVVSFFASKKAFEILNFENSNVYSAISAVVVLHFALGLYLYKAYSADGEKAKPSHQAKQD